MAAYAGAGIANANAFKAGNTAFRLSLGKVLVPVVFAFQPALAAAVSNWLFAPLRWYKRTALVLAAILLIAPDLTATLVGILLIAPVAVRQLWQKQWIVSGAVVFFDEFRKQARRANDRGLGFAIERRFSYLKTKHTSLIWGRRQKGAAGASKARFDAAESALHARIRLAARSSS
jgi:hypothetical protein